MSKDHIIWQDEHLDLKDWIGDLREYHPDATESELWSIMCETNSGYLEDEQGNLSGVILPRPILVVGDLGLWHGRVPGCKLIASGKVSDCLSTAENGTACWYVDARGDFRGRLNHHDGTNRMLYRGVRPGVSDEALDTLCQKIYDRKDFKKDLSRLTFRLGDLIGDVYGWTFARRPNITIKRSCEA